MKRIITITGIFFLVLTAFAQDKNRQTEVLPYDSTTNFLGKNAMAYKGQELYLKGLDKSSQSYGYNGFILNYKKDDDLLNDEKNIYKPNENYNSRYEDLAGRYFNVVDVIKKDDKRFYLQLQEITSGDIVYFKYETNAGYTFPFIVRAFLEKQKALLTGKEYVITNDILKSSRNLRTGKALTFTTGETWKCTDVTVDNNVNEVVLVLQNNKRTTTTLPYPVLSNNNEGIKKVYTAEEAKSLTRKYNVHNFRRILENKIRTGMTKEMTRLAWGEPTEISQNGKNEIWQYPAGKLTFRGDKIISTK